VTGASSSDSERTFITGEWAVWAFEDLLPVSEKVGAGGIGSSEVGELEEEGLEARRGDNPGLLVFMVEVDGEEGLDEDLG
jgi:hypothetical protein